MPGTVARTVRWLPVTFQPTSCLVKRTSALTSSRSGGLPAFARKLENCIEKQDACAAASNSSGLVRPSGSSVRDFQLTGMPLIVPLVTLSIVPEPLSRSPVQVTSARRTASLIDPPFPCP
jgi:hypothetical protein